MSPTLTTRSFLPASQTRTPAERISGGHTARDSVQAVKRGQAVSSSRSEESDSRLPRGQEPHDCRKPLAAAQGQHDQEHDERGGEPAADGGHVPSWVLFLTAAVPLPLLQPCQSESLMGGATAVPPEESCRRVSSFARSDPIR
jgi:hypothetical protein